MRLLVGGRKKRREGERGRKIKSAGCGGTDARAGPGWQKAASDITGQLVSKEAFLLWSLHRSRGIWWIGHPSLSTHTNKGKFCSAIGNGQRAEEDLVSWLQGIKMLIGQSRKWSAAPLSPPTGRHQLAVCISRELLHLLFPQPKLVPKGGS